MAHSPLYGTANSGMSERSSFGDLEPLIDVFLDRFGDLSVIAIDLGAEAAVENGLRRSGYKGLCDFLARADVVGRLRSGTLAAIMIGYAADAARWEAEKVWRSAGEDGPGLPRITLGITQYEFGDSVDGLVARAERALRYGRRHGADKAIELNRSGHMVISDFHGQKVSPKPASDTASTAAEETHVEAVMMAIAAAKHEEKQLPLLMG